MTVGILGFDGFNWSKKRSVAFSGLCMTGLNYVTCQYTLAQTVAELSLSSRGGGGRVSSFLTTCIILVLLIHACVVETDSSPQIGMPSK